MGCEARGAKLRGLLRLRAGVGAAALLGAGLAGLALYLLYAQRAAGNFGFPLDDSWIHLQIARNVATGHGWSYNPGEPTGASTTPLWVLLITPLFWLPGDVTAWVKAAGSGLFLANIFLAADLAQRATGDRRVAWLTGLLTAWGPTAVWGALSGMEVHLYLLLALLGLRAALVAGARGRPGYAATAWLALAGWARPEVWALTPAVWGYLGFVRSARTEHFQPPRGQAAWRPWAPHLLIAGASIAAFFAFNRWISGQPLPGAWYAKTAFGDGDTPLNLAAALLHFGGQLMSNVQAAVYSQNPWLAVTLALGGLALWQAGPRPRRGLILLLAAAAAAMLAAAAADLGSIGLQSYRRGAHLIACLNVLAAAGAVALWDAASAGRRRDAPQAGRRRTSAWLLAAAVLAMQFAGLRQGAILYADNVRSINGGDVAAARWLAANTPADASVAVNDIGAIAYFSGRRIVDLVGLASPDVVAVTATSQPGSAEREARLRDLLLAGGVDYVVIFPQWFPHLARDPALVEVARFTVPGATALAYDTVVVYRLAAAGQRVP